MRKYIIPIVMALLLSSCAAIGNKYILPEDTNSIANATIEEMIGFIKNRDAIALRAMFSLNTQRSSPYFGDDLTELIEFIEGDVISVSDAIDSGMSSERRYDYGKIIVTIQPCFTIITEKSKYYLAFFQCLKDNNDSDNIGITTLFVINADDWDRDYVYRGDGSFENPGIYVGRKALERLNDY